MKSDCVHMNALTLEINLCFNFVDHVKPPPTEIPGASLFQQLNLSPALFSRYYPMSLRMTNTKPSKPH